MNRSKWLAGILIAFALTACREPRSVIFDTDWWTDVDDACAIRLLLDAERKGQISLLGICLSAVRETSVSSLSAFLSEEGRTDVLLGEDRQAVDYTGVPSYHQYILDAAPEWPAFLTAEDCVSFYRRLLSRSRRKVDLIAVGYPNALARLLQSGPDSLSRKSGEELVRRKVRHLWMMAGEYPEGRENNFARTPRSRTAGRILLDRWPTSVTFLGYETGIRVMVGGVLPPDDLLKRILEVHGSGTGRYAWDPMLTEIACAGDPAACGYKTISGTVQLDEDTGENRFIPSLTGLHRYVRMTRPPEEYRRRLDSLLLRR